MLKVLGLGNVLRGDDGIGPVIISELEKKTLPLPVKLIDIGSDLFTILQYLIADDPVLIIDCAKMGKSPGDIMKFRVEDSNLESIEKVISLHGYGFGDVYRMAQSLGKKTKSIIIGIEPKSIEFNTPLSKEVKNSIPSIIKMVIEEINNYAQKNINH